MEDDDDEDEDDDDYDDNEENDAPNNNKSMQKQSKMRGKRPTGNIMERALVTDFASSDSINANFPKYSGSNKYGIRNVPKDLLQEFDNPLRKARAVSAWRRLSPNQQKDICDQLATQRKQKVSAARELKEIKKKKKQAEKEIAKQRNAETKAAKKKATEENRKAKKKETEQRRRNEAKAIAAQVCMFGLLSFFSLLFVSLLFVSLTLLWIVTAVETDRQ